jgi:protocatechuate 3,4-dioxygenase alpha subunit
VPPLTPSQTIGPFFAHALPYIDGGNIILTGEAPRIELEVTVLDGAGAPVADAVLECWQADAEGRYHDGLEGFGRAATDEHGVARFTTVKPGPITDPSGVQAPHIAPSVFARGILNRLVTRIYFDDEPPKASDPVFSCYCCAARVSATSTRRSTFPIIVLGRSARNSTFAGTL